MWLDILCVIIILIGAFFGYRRGFMGQVGSVIGLILGIICCNLFAHSLAQTFTETTDEAATVMWNNVMAYFIVFAIAYIGGRLIGSLFTRAIKAMHLGIVNRIGGAVFMPLEYLLVLSIILNAWIGVFPQTQLRSNITGVKEMMLNLAPKVLGSPTVNDIFDKVKDSLKKQSDGVEEEDSVSNEAQDFLITPEPQPKKNK